MSNMSCARFASLFILTFLTVAICVLTSCPSRVGSFENVCSLNSLNDTLLCTTSSLTFVSVSLSYLSMDYPLYTLQINCQGSNVSEPFDLRPFAHEAVATLRRVEFNGCNFIAGTAKQPYAGFERLLNKLSFQCCEFHVNDLTDVYPRFSKLQELTSLTFSTNTLRESKFGSAVLDLPFQFANALRCLHSDEDEDDTWARNCFCSPGTLSSNASDYVYQMYCFNATVNEIVKTLESLHKSGEFVQSLGVLHLPFEDRALGSEEDEADAFFNTHAQGFNFGIFPHTIDIYACGPLSSNAQSARGEIQKLLHAFENADRTLHSLSIAGCDQVEPLETLSSALVSHGVKSLNLQFNNLDQQQIEERFYAIQLAGNQIETLLLAHNRLQKLTEKVGTSWALEKLKLLDLSDNLIAEIEDSAFDPFVSLVSLNMSHNKLAFIKSRWFNRMRTLNYLDLSRNKIAGIWSLDGYYRAPWPENLLVLNLSNSDFIGNKRPDDIVFDENVFLGLEKLRVLDLSAAELRRCTSRMFKPLRSLQSLNLEDNIYLDVSDYGKSIFEHLPTLRSLSLGKTWGLPRKRIFPTPCKDLKYMPLLRELNVQDNPVQCKNVHPFLAWLAYKKKSGQFALNGIGHTHCLDGDKADAVTVKFNEWSNGSTQEHEYCRIEQTAQAVDTARNSKVRWLDVGKRFTERKSVQIERLIRISFFVIFAFFLLAVLLIVSFSLLRRHSTNKSRRLLSSNLHYKHEESQPLSEVSGPASKKANGSLIPAYSLQQLIKCVFLLSVVAILLLCTLSVWIQYSQGSQMAQLATVSGAQFSQRPFALCIPITRRPVQLSDADVEQLLQGDMCCEEDIAQALPLHNELVLDLFLQRLGFQLAWEGGIMSKSFETSAHVAATISARRISKRKLLREVGAQLCRKMNITALHYDANSCAALFGESDYFGLTWYDDQVTKEMCFRFPGLTSIDNKVAKLSLMPLQFFPSPPAGRLDLHGHTYQFCSRQSGFSIPIPSQQHTTLQIKVKALYRSDIRSCYEDCLGSTRAAEIQRQCKCRPLMWSSLSNRDLSDCSIDLYRACNLSETITDIFKQCRDTKPCEQFDYQLISKTSEPTVDNSTSLTLEFAESMYAMFTETRGLNVAFDGEVSLGVWLVGTLTGVALLFAALCRTSTRCAQYNC